MEIVERPEGGRQSEFTTSRDWRDFWMDGFETSRASSQKLGGFWDAIGLSCFSEFLKANPHQRLTIVDLTKSGIDN